MRDNLSETTTMVPSPLLFLASDSRLLRLFPVPSNIYGRWRRWWPSTAYCQTCQVHPSPPPLHNQSFTVGLKSGLALCHVFSDSKLHKISNTYRTSQTLQDLDDEESLTPHVRVSCALRTQSVLELFCLLL